MIAFEARAAHETRALAARRGVPLADVACVLSGKRDLFADFVHFTGDGAGLVAAVVEGTLNPETGSAIAQAGLERRDPDYCD
jgi:lysophospholipase L1-like esterase